MGNHKMRLSNIIPNAWFHKLKEMGMITTNKSTRNQHFPATTTIDILDQDADPSPSLPRKSYHFTRKRRPTSKKTTNSTPTPSFTTTTKSSSSSSVSAACSCRSTATATVQSTIRSKPGSSPIQESPPSSSPDQILRSFDRMVAWSSASGHCTSIISPIPDNNNDNDNNDDDNNDDDHNDVVIGVDKMSLRCKTGEDPMSRVGLSPIRTDHKKFNELVKEIGEADEQLLLIDNPNKQRKSSVKYRSNISTGSGSPRVRIRINSPKLSKRMENGGGRRSTSRGGKRKKSISRESLAVVKSSSDPERDFRESMMEMIAENEMRGSKELEELLACYLSLNSAEYHHLIVHVFQQIWFDLYHIR